MADKETRLTEGAKERIREMAKEYSAPYMARMSKNIKRLGALINSAADNRDAGDDVLRAAVVFTHAYLEDFLRTLAVKLLPSADERVLNDIPLAGMESTGRAEKFFLGKLVQHKGKSVDEVLRESVAASIDRSTFNNINDVAALLKSLGFDPSERSEYFPAIEEMMKRRHQIVHRADEQPPKAGLQSISQDQVYGWMEATFKLMASIPLELFLRDTPIESIAKRLEG